ncbi:MAG TPA: subclass B3 metallo-beta-lactamase [Pyrinomonadaceae bacterium]|nr:subclass B3 metallo-beta-lactamase [Pyrinomonadaceae bacterium]
MLNKILTICGLLLLASVQVSAQIDDDEGRKWNQPVKPYKVIGNVYYVGATEVSSFLIVTSQGLILIDSGFLETVPLIKQNVAQLGFRFEDIKILLNSHAHADHAGGLARLKQMTGAKLMVSEADAALLARGGKNDPNFGDRFLFEPVKADRILRDGDTVQLGDVTMTARLTPGHTAGCTTWTMKVREGSKTYDVVVIGSTTIPGYKLIGNTGYPNIVSDYEASFRLLKTLPCDVFLAPHGSFYSMLEKMKRLSANPSENPFIDKRALTQFVDRTEKDFRAELKRQQDATNTAAQP